MMPRPVLGIDFGTTNTSAAWIDHKRTLRVVPVSERSAVLPTVVWFRARDKHVVGSNARTQLIDDPTHTIHGFKRFLGRSLKSSFVQRHRERFLYPLVPDELGLCAVEIYGQVVHLREVATLVLRRIAELAQAAAGAPFEDCVLTVPAHYGYTQRRELARAASDAGLRVRALVNEPTAAALFAAKKRGIEQTLLIYDLGGGTFDVSVVAVRGALASVLATGGDAFLGGADFDEQIGRRLIERFEVARGLDVQSNKVVMQRVFLAAEAAKIALSTQEETTLRVPFVCSGADGQFVDFEYTLIRDALETLTSNLIERTLGACDEALKHAGMTRDDVDELVFVGGQTRMLPLKRRLSAAFKNDPTKAINPELAVAVGAAILGHSMDLPAGPDLVDVVSIPIGVVLPGGAMHEVIPRNTGVPCRRGTSVSPPVARGQDLVMGLIQAVELHSVERELVGLLRVPADWLQQNPGPLQLELVVEQDFSLKASVARSERRRLDLPILPPPI
ncbi:MAG: Hsp70 family protein [Pseudomonadota bacterium]